MSERCPLTRSSRNLHAAVCAVIVVAGCGSPSTTATRDAKQPTTRPTLSPEATGVVDCSARLHDVSGALLLYYFTYRRLPARLDEVNTFPGADETIPLTCPTSGLPYVYDRDGIQLAEKHTRVIVYDPTPSHGGRRMAIRFSEPTDDKAIVVDVIALPESFFLFRPPIATTLPTE